MDLKIVNFTNTWPIVRVKVLDIHCGYAFTSQLLSSGVVLMGRWSLFGQCGVVSIEWSLSCCGLGCRLTTRTILVMPSPQHCIMITQNRNLPMYREDDSFTASIHTR